MPTGIMEKSDVRTLLQKASGMTGEEGDARLKAVIHDLLAAVFSVIDKHDITEDELWQAVSYAQTAAPEFGLLVPGLGIEHFMDLVLDARDEEAQRACGTPRTIEGPLFVEGAPLSEGSASLNRSGEEGTRLDMEGTVFDKDGAPLAGAIIDVWHADGNGAYSIFDESQPPFNFRAKIKTDAEGRYSFDTVVPVGYSCPPGGTTETLLARIGRHSSRPAHIHFFVRADQHRSLTTQINIADDPLVHDDFAFATREGLIPPIEREDGSAHITFDFRLCEASSEADEGLSSRTRVEA